MRPVVLYYMYVRIKIDVILSKEKISAVYRLYPDEIVF